MSTSPTAPLRELISHASESGLLRHLEASEIFCFWQPDITEPSVFLSPALARLMGLSVQEAHTTRARCQPLWDLEPVLRGLSTNLLSAGEPAPLTAITESAVAIGAVRGEFRARCSLHRDSQNERPSLFGVLTPAADQMSADLVRRMEGVVDELLDNVAGPALIASADGRVLRANAALHQMYSPGTLKQQPIAAVFADTNTGAAVDSVLTQVLSTGAPQQLEVRQFDRTWSVRVIALPSSLAEIGRVLIIAEDVTERKKQEQQAMLREHDLHDTLIAELNHRTKNHLQAVVGLLRRAGSPNHSSQESVEAAILHVLTIATVHGMLSDQGGYRLDLRQLLSAIIRLVQANTGILIELQSSVSSALFLRQEFSVPIALSLAELITNASKHTPQDRRQASACSYCTSPR